MGLCKCPKRKVTNLFCFEHRVNVCESCLLANHESCVVQTYLSWLTDSDYDANCPLCFEPLNSKETVRLKCLHLFHWDCFDARARQLPDTTAPAGYKCPSCLECIFPAENQQSPVVDKLRIRLQSVNWGRLGIGLASLPELDQKMPSAHLLNSSANSFNGPLPPHYHQQQHPSPSPPSILNNSIPNSNIAQQQYDDPFEMNTFTARTKLLTESNGSLSSSVYIGNGNGTGADNLDESKYAKKAAAERNIRQRFARLPRSLKRIFLAIAAVGLIYLILHWMNTGGGGNGGQEDPLFDPHANPNIRVERQHPMEGAKGES